jgi:diketogulonate reductase-like aldo/keto reductase
MMPKLIQGLPLILNLASISQKEFSEIIRYSLQCNIRAFDTSHDYGKSEQFLGKAMKQLARENVNREDLFIVSKIGNGQQYEGHIERCVDLSLKTMQTDYLDLMLLHWPVPDYYINNWKKLEKVYQTGKVKAIGIANPQIRHLEALFQAKVECLPHVIQTEIHPFNTCRDLVDYCKERSMALQACTALCQMIPLVTENQTLQKLAKQYHCSIAQLILCWHIEQDIAPVFRSYNKKHLDEISRLYQLELSDADRTLMTELNIDYRYHPESLNCPGF